MAEKNIEVSLLLDFYGELLKPGVRMATDLYYNDDLSLAEVAAQCGITRQGVRDSVKRGEMQLFEFERKLGLLRRFREVEDGLNEIRLAAAEIAANSQETNTVALAREIIRRADGLNE